MREKDEIACARVRASVCIGNDRLWPCVARMPLPRPACLPGEAGQGQGHYAPREGVGLGVQLGCCQAWGGWWCM